MDNSVEPAVVTIGFSSSPLIKIFTGPCCTSLDCAKRSIKTSSNIIMVNAAIDVRTIEVIEINVFTTKI